MYVSRLLFTVVVCFFFGSSARCIQNEIIAASTFCVQRPGLRCLIWPTDEHDEDTNIALFDRKSDDVSHFHVLVLNRGYSSFKIVPSVLVFPVVVHTVVSSLSG